jgi:DNA-binding GntR family transcriptional regulator
LNVEEPELSQRLAHHKIERTVLVDDVYEAIKSSVMDLVIAPGERINIGRLARELAVSPSPVREALARLEAEHLVVKEPMKGYTSTKLLNRAEVMELFELRMLIEPWAAAKAARSLSPKVRAALVEELDGTTDAPLSSRYGEYRALTAHDERFHGLLAQAANNQRVVEVLDGLHIHLHLFRLNYRQQVGVSTIDEHQKIGAALVAGDPDAAEAAMRAHLEAALARLLPGFNADGNFVASHGTVSDVMGRDRS